MVRALRTLTFLVAAAVVAAGCSVKDTKTPALSGPSELGLSLTLQASPDTITQDGASQSQISILARDASSNAVANLSVGLTIAVGGTAVDYGTLSTKTLVTNSTGRASAVYTAPAAAYVASSSGTVVTVLATPIGSDYANTISRSVSIRLVPSSGMVVGSADVTPAIAFSPQSPAVGETVTFVGSCTGTTCSQVTTYAWSFGDGSTTTGTTATHEFTSAGTFTVTLTLTDSYGRTKSTTATVKVATSTAPTASFVFSPSAPIPAQAVYFNASASKAGTGRTITVYGWDFGDGVHASGVTATHAYSTIGTYTVTLTVGDDLGNSGSTSTTVTVSATGTSASVAAFTYSPTTPAAGETVHFNGSDSYAASGVAQYVWDFGDGQTAKGVTATHAFVTAGTYVVRLTITDNSGATATTTQEVTVS